MDKLKIAIQKSGRLYDDSIKLLKDCSIEVNIGIDKLKTTALNFPLEILFLRDDDIPQYLEDGVADIGIVGKNVLLEKRKKIKIKETLGFGKCRLAIAIPKSLVYKEINDLNGKIIATSYPFLVREFFEKKYIKAEIHEISGAVEIAPGIGLADCICDLVSSGSTLFMNGLKEVETILQSEAVLASNLHLGEPQNIIMKKLLFRIRSVKKAKNHKYILLNVSNEHLEKIISHLPGIKSLVIFPLENSKCSSVHFVVNENNFWRIIENLKALGAQDILVLPIEKIIL
ncbi:ATP phosphoribosyltransferase [Blattabacterium sp. (Cryptocercus punctulatus) str. Cpu]|uniref:ATP phosphoribosyltransferase n=1 Tax=Blattabacterium sp. (Cryptocercus punctulatus) str. Cpu TaxID=1075399 RepID=UPI0002387145|nr:ATP phosphoribosyltransferase [Blattabacterium sp. (Cryptocercus punctulatus) str. Cpu]AEU09444.1 ATP phosphoribosyltransferase [Blattabacterium sp. (Cryptocercus punctulatus) str. Cpu]